MLSNSVEFVPYIYWRDPFQYICMYDEDNFHISNEDNSYFEYILKLPKCEVTI